MQSKEVFLFKITPKTPLLKRAKLFRLISQKIRKVHSMDVSLKKYLFVTVGDYDKMTFFDINNIKVYTYEQPNHLSYTIIYMKGNNSLKLYDNGMFGTRLRN